jgi:hypothetical protein
MDAPDYIERLVDHDDPLNQLLRAECEAEGTEFFEEEHNEVREQILTRSFIEDTRDGFRCRVDRTHSKVTITRTLTKRSKS